MISQNSKSFLFCLALFICTAKISAQQIESISFEQLHSRLSNSNDTLYVINFWATWCKPCIEELPGFEKCNEEFSKNKVRILLVNLDFNSQMKTSAETFVQKKKIRSSVLHITDTDPNTWINRIDSGWSGAIPATVMYKNSQKLFFTEGQISEVSLKKEITIKLTNQK